MVTEVPTDPADREIILGEIRPENAADHHQLLREILDAKIALRRAGEDCEHFENLYHCAYLLYLVGDPQDVPALWSAKQIDFDSFCAFDTQIFLGAGVKETLDYLRANGHAEMVNELATFAELDDDLDDDLDEWSSFQRNYFYPS
jgi:hypothetical protein